MGRDSEGESWDLQNHTPVLAWELKMGERMIPPQRMVSWDSGLWVVGVEAGGQEVQGHPQLGSEFEASQLYMEPYLRKKKE